MAKAFVRVSLATKLRVLFAAAVLAIIGSALAVPWYFTERMADQAVENAAAQVARMSLNEWIKRHQTKPLPPSEIAQYFTAEDTSGRCGPVFVPLPAGKNESLEEPVRQAFKGFLRDHEQRIALTSFEGAKGERLYRAFRAVRAGKNCRSCHDGVIAKAFQSNQLVGLIDLTMPPASASLIWWTRGVFLLGGLLAAFLAFVVFYLITKKTVLSPIRKLRELSDRVAQGDLTQRSGMATGDEFERMAKSFNAMLDAIQSQQDQLRQANRALDLRLGELSESNVALFEANRIKSEFLANVSHELRTPLNSVIGFAELLAETDDEKRRRHAGHILTSAKLLLSIINDLLDMAQLEAGKAHFRPEKTSITDLCETIAQLVRPLADKKDLQLAVDLAAQLPVVYTDGRKCQQVLYNLLSNAIKFTPPQGKVTLTASAVWADSSPLGTDSVAVAVADTGPGIATADQERIFEKFNRLDSALTKESAGAGLGLAISRDLTGLLGGKLTLQSEPGQGATFTLFVPIGTPPAENAPEPEKTEPVADSQ